MANYFITNESGNITKNYTGSVSKVGVNKVTPDEENVEPDPTLCFDDFNKTKGQGEDNSSTEEKER